jgi:hypothetical protein
MKRAGVVLAVVMGFAGLCPAGVTEFADRVATVNAPMLSGVVQFEMAVTGVRNGDPYSYVEVGTYTYNAEQGLFDKELIAGTPHVALVLEGKQEIAKHTIIAVDSQGWSSYSPDGANVLRRTDQIMSMEGLALLTGNVLGFDLREAVRDHPATVKGNSLIFDDSHGGLWTIVTDADDKLATVAVDQGGRSQVYTLTDHVRVGQSWLPCVVVFNQRPVKEQDENRDWRTTQYTLKYQPGSPSEDELMLPAPAQAPVRTVNVESDGQTSQATAGRPPSDRLEFGSELYARCGKDVGACHHPGTTWSYCCNATCSGETFTECEYWTCCSGYFIQDTCMWERSIIGSLWDNCVFEYYHPRGYCAPYWPCKVDSTTHHDITNLVCAWP